jgi:wobble nucleotide-excising tRNase
VSFRKFTLIFGENGRGKTTLCAIFRSLQTRHSAFIHGRRTLGSSDKPQVTVTLTSGQVIFQNGTWSSATFDINLRIFDAHYIAENIYSGDAISVDQRRNLCRVILGQQGVTLANRYDEVDKEIGEFNATIRAARGIITSHTGPMEIEKFLALPPDPDIDAHIETKTIRVQGLKETDQLKRRASLTTLETPPLPSHLQSVLSRTLEDVSRDAERLVRTHITSHGMAAHGEEWIAAGLSHLADESCPFCGQSLLGLDLLTAYRTFFNDSYRELQSELMRYRTNTARLFSDERIELLRTHATGNLTGIDLWGRYVAISKPDPLDLDQLTSVMTAFRGEMLVALDRKLASPLDTIEPPPTYGAARDRYAALLQTIGTYNQQIITANLAIESFKTMAIPVRTEIEERELALLRIRRKRFEPQVQAACQQFKSASVTKVKAEEEKRKVRDQLDRYVESVLFRYQNAINGYLKHFTAGFHIDRVKVEYSGRVPNSTFCIVINKTAVEVGREDTRLDQPSFRNTLSAGDRSTLALAFFLAQLKEDPDRSKCVAIFDDPFGSQDQFRRTCTIGEIQRCGEQVAQVVVMSHDPRFLKAIWDLPLPTADRKALWLIPSGERDTEIGEWDIAGDTESEDAADRRVLLEFYHHPGAGDPRDVIKKLRPVAETHMRRLAPSRLAVVRGLGDMIQRIRSDQRPESLVDSLPDLTDINTYTRRYMHGETQNAASEPVSRGELQGFVCKLLEIVGAMSG